MFKNRHITVLWLKPITTTGLAKNEHSTSLIKYSRWIYWYTVTRSSLMIIVSRHSLEGCRFNSSRRLKQIVKFLQCYYRNTWMHKKSYLYRAYIVAYECGDISIIRNGSKFRNGSRNVTKIQSIISTSKSVQKYLWLHL